MHTEDNLQSSSDRKPSTPRRRPVKVVRSALEKLTDEELQTLRLDEPSRSQFDALVQDFGASTAQLRTLQGEDESSTDDERYDERSAAEAEVHKRGMAVVHFMAPRILRLRDGAAKRKWRSFLTKFRKDERLG